jgi:anaerobic ribonucleoside-triphosphate reductase activating protein
VSTLVSWCKQVGVGGLDGITVSGGEPFDQPEALKDLLLELCDWRTDAGLDFDILVYSGYALSQLERGFASTVRLADVVVPGPYVASRPSPTGLTGSTNQTLHFSNDDVQQRYMQWLDEQAPGTRRRIQVAVDEAGVWFVGIPVAGDLAKLEDRCREAGLELKDPSWRA